VEEDDDDDEEEDDEDEDDDDDDEVLIFFKEGSFMEHSNHFSDVVMAFNIPVIIFHMFGESVLPNFFSPSKYW
jgi:hypothetical protein